MMVDGKEWMNLQSQTQELELTRLCSSQQGCKGKGGMRGKPGFLVEVSGDTGWIGWIHWMDQPYDAVSANVLT